MTALLFAVIMIVSAKPHMTSIDSMKFKIEQQEQQFNSLNRDIKEVRLLLDKQDKVLDTQLNIISNSNDSISNQISSTSNLISIAGLIFGLFGLFIGVYITVIQNRSSAILTQSKEILEKVIAIQKDVDTTKKQIDNDLKGIYLKIQEQEIEYILNRLEKIPEDINHVFNRLASLEMHEKYFDRIKPMIINQFNKTKHSDFVMNLSILAIQHHSALVVKDEQLTNIILNCPVNLLASCYASELNALTVVFFRHIENVGIISSAEKIKSFLEKIEEVNCAEETSNTLFEIIDNKHKRFELCRIIKSHEPLNMTQKSFFRLIYEKHSEETNSDEENQLLSEINIIYKTLSPQ
ncbi:MAG: hypothetical protein JXC36_07840 [Candidatus Atribacteria bacterium]|nr:hypothetical protein [Candidatus Atribacteria bacterium]